MCPVVVVVAAPDVEAGLGVRLLAELNAQLGARGLILRRGTLIDASIVMSAARLPVGNAGEVSPCDPDAGGTKKNGKNSFAYKAPIGTDEGSEPVRRPVLTTIQIDETSRRFADPGEAHERP